MSYEELLDQARLVANSLHRDHFYALTGTGADVQTHDYLHLKEQLGLVRQANDSYRFLYLVGQRPSGEIFFFVDNRRFIFSLIITMVINPGYKSNLQSYVPQKTNEV